MISINPDLYEPMNYCEGYKKLSNLSQDNIQMLLARASFRKLYAQINATVGIMYKYNLGQFSVAYPLDIGGKIITVRLINYGNRIEILDGKVLRKAQ